MKIIKEIAEIRELIRSLKKPGKTQKKVISFVPTMGFLHQGHLSLIDSARKHSDVIVVSIFVNQKQFNDQSDFTNYPKNLESDIKKLESAKVDILFCPEIEEIYPEKNLINFEISDLTKNLCGQYRKGHFEGMALIVAKLFNIVCPDLAVFGQKDFQQLQIVRKIVQDLNFDIEIIAAPTLREESGLAMSSRNSRLNDDDLKKAAKIYEILQDLKQKILQNEAKNLDILIKNSRDKLLKYFDKVDYLELCQEKDLKIVEIFDKKIESRIFVAAYIGEVRLIDNIKVI